MTAQSAENTIFTGKRKTAVARISIKPGDGKIIVNKKNVQDFFPTNASRKIITLPFELTNTEAQYDVCANVRGGGISSQAAAIRHAIARALQIMNPALRESLKKNGLLTRDARKKERKKPGQKGARKKFQFSKR